MNYCPSCTSELQRTSVAAIELVQCAPCAGILVGWAGLEQLFASAPKSEALIAYVAGLNSSDHQGPVRNHPVCPVCRRAFTARRLKKSVTAFYYCEAHGAMFDTSTLTLLLTGVVSGIAPDTTVAAAAATSSDDDSWFEGGTVLELVVDVLNGLLD